MKGSDVFHMPWEAQLLSTRLESQDRISEVTKFNLLMLIFSPTDLFVEVITRYDSVTVGILL